MPPRRHTNSSSSISKAAGCFSPDASVASYKDVLLFEERLKQNAALLRSRKRKYEVFLAILCCTILVLTHKSFLRPSPTPSLHYFHLSLLPVAIVTLILFFASGMYAERIGYANRYVPHANRALRSLNMHLNMRVQPTPLIPYIPFPLSLLLPTTKTPPTQPLVKTASPAPSRPSTPPQIAPKLIINNPGTASTSPLRSSSSPISAATRASPTPVTTIKPIPHIPPTSNPRGELIFSSRVDRSFREGYERYRAMFEKRREERYRETRAAKTGLMGWWWWALGYRRKKVGPSHPGAAGAGVVDGAGGGGRKRNGTSTPPTTGSSVSSSDRGSGLGGAGSKGSSRTPSPSGFPASSSVSSTSLRTTSNLSRTISAASNLDGTTTTSTTTIRPYRPPASSRSALPESTTIPEGEAVPLDEVGERLRSIRREGGERREEGGVARDDRRNRAESFSFLLAGVGSADGTGGVIGGGGIESGRVIG